jgi:NAD(P)-dependent dehydrogenase (short-subunit alcohol dehydrogenase family)
MSFDLQLAGKRALVTGGTKGIGAATVAMLVRASARVAVAARSQPTQATDGVFYLAADLSTQEGTHAAAESVLEHFGGIDILVNVVCGPAAQ